MISRQNDSPSMVYGSTRTARCSEQASDGAC